MDGRQFTPSSDHSWSVGIVRPSSLSTPVARAWPPLHVHVPPWNVRSWVLMLPCESKKCVRNLLVGVVADHLDPPDIGVADAAVGRVDHEESTRHPLIDVARLNLDGAVIRSYPDPCPHVRRCRA